eukprot:TRINITY_DN12867_c0_g1_i5.p1 TRINITY_DN12867_c0_g1~~TRINITY_DN12867_c0_g1_i5.p1  ORF type:complete len:1691 (-),score=396.59 TRINITY_DN12867_c0_g1_i5:417-5489(-)
MDGATASSQVFTGHTLVPLPPDQMSLVGKLIEKLEKQWRLGLEAAEDSDLSTAVYDTNLFLRRRVPDEIEEVLATFDQDALNQIQMRFGDRALSLLQFAEAIVQSGTYDPIRVPAFIGGVVDMFLEVQRSQKERALGAPPQTVLWGQLMNHLIESPEIGLFKGELGCGAENARDSTSSNQMNRSTTIDCAKHPGGIVEKVYWLSYLGDLATVEGTESVYFWTPTGKSIESYRAELTPQLPDEFYDEHHRSLWSIQAIAWDGELNDITALLSNRMLITWRLRSREKGQFQQKRELRIHANKTVLPGSAFSSGDKEQAHVVWKLELKHVDMKTESKAPRGSSSPSHSRGSGRQGDHRAVNPKAEQNQQLAKRREEREAAEVATMLDIWWNVALKMYVTTDRRGRLFFWDLRKVESSLLEDMHTPAFELSAHKRAVTGHCEISKHKFATCSLDHMVMLWDNRNLNQAPEMTIKDHSNAVLSLAYLPMYSSLVTVGCEKRVFVWSVDSTAYRGVRAKLSGHGANLRQVSAGAKVFFTLDERCVAILWDGATLANLQTINAENLQPKLCTVMPTMGRLCLSGRRLNFFDGNETVAPLIGAALTKEQMAKRKAEEATQASLKERAKPKWCGLSPCRGSMLSVTEVEIKMHARGSPADARIIFNAPEGESITSFCAMDEASLVVLGTSKGGVHFLKHRSGFAVKVYPGRKAEEKAAKAQPRQAALPATPGGGPASPTAGGMLALADGDAGDVSPGRASRVGFLGGDTPAAARLRAMSTQSRSGAGSPVGFNVPDFGADAAEEEGGGGGVQKEQGEMIRQGPVQYMANAPTPEEIQEGLSTQITCVLACQEHGRVFAGTTEGRVLVFALEEDFPVIRWTSPESPSAVTCLQWIGRCAIGDADGDPGLLAVGTHDGVVQLYGMAQLKPAGLVQMHRILPEEDPEKRVPIRYLILSSVTSDPMLPCTMLTIDAQSRIRLWGLRVDMYSGKLVDLRLVLDGGILLPLRLDDDGCATAVAKPGEAEQEEERRKAEAEREKKAKADAQAAQLEAAAKKGKAALQAEEERLRVEPKQPSVLDLPPAHSKDSKITALTVVSGQLAIPSFARMKWAKEARNRPPPHPEVLPEEEDPLAFMTQTPASPSKRPSSNQKSEKGGKKDKDKEGEECSDYNKEKAEIVQSRLDVRPRTPPLPLHGETPPFTYGDGDRLLFIADSEGWIRCLDIGHSVDAAVEAMSPVPVHIEDPVVSATARAGFSTTSPAAQADVSTSLLSVSGIQDEGSTLLLGPMPAPKPEVCRVLGAWRASNEAVLSLVPASGPCGLVSVDASKEVKVWSTTGELWSHFSLRTQDGQIGPPLLWPPPHTLASQLALMEVAKGLTEKLGLDMSRKKLSGRQRVSSKQQRKGQQQQGYPSKKEKASAAGTTADAAEGGPAGGGGGGGKAAFKARMMAKKAAQEAAAEVPAAAEEPAGAPATEADAAEPHDDGEEEDSPMPIGDGQPGPPTAAERRAQLQEMISKGALSAGFRSYREFQSANQRKLKHAPQQPEKRPPMPQGKPTTSEFQGRRSDFFVRRPSAYGVELSTSREEQYWDSGTRGLGARSASDGALVRYVDAAVSECTGSVRRNLGVDVSVTSRRTMHKPSFVAGLDINGVSADPTNPKSATGQAVKKLLGGKSKSATSLSAMMDTRRGSTLQGAGGMALRGK